MLLLQGVLLEGLCTLLMSRSHGVPLREAPPCPCLAILSRLPHGLVVYRTVHPLPEALWCTLKLMD